MNITDVFRDQRTYSIGRRRTWYLLMISQDAQYARFEISLTVSMDHIRECTVVSRSICKLRGEWGAESEQESSAHTISNSTDHHEYEDNYNSVSFPARSSYWILTGINHGQEKVICPQILRRSLGDKASSVSRIRRRRIYTRNRANRSTKADSCRPKNAHSTEL